MEIGMTLLGQALSFAILIWFTMRFIWPPLMAAIEERQRRIADGLAAADQARADLKLADERAGEEVRKARVEASGIVDRANQQYAQILESAKSDAIAEGLRQKQLAETEIATLSERAREFLRQQVAALAVAGAGRIIAREIDPATHRDLLDRLAAEL
ncbi:MAG: F0F1 ATP synthase subunit B [Lysobacterales bacterium]